MRKWSKSEEAEVLRINIDRIPTNLTLSYCKWINGKDLRRVLVYCTEEKNTKETLIGTVQNYEACFNQRYRAFFVVICHLIILVNLFIDFFLLFFEKMEMKTPSHFFFWVKLVIINILACRILRYFFVASVLFKSNCHGWEMSQGDKLENHTKRIHEKFYLTVDCCL